MDTIGMLFVDGTLIDHDTFVREQGVPNTLYLTHTQILRFICKGWAPDGKGPMTHELVHMIYLMGNGSHLTKWLAHGIKAHTAISLQSLREKCNVEIGRELTDKERKGFLEYPRKVSRNPKFKFIQLMILHRAYLSPHRLNMMFTDTNTECPRCHVPDADLLHMLWSCPRILVYLSTIQSILTAIAPGSGKQQFRCLPAGNRADKKDWAPYNPLS